MILFGVAAIQLPFADLEIVSTDPWSELGRFALGFLTPDISLGSELVSALALTVAFAFVGLVVSNLFGFLLSLVFDRGWVRVSCAVLRSVHEIFWALIFLQLFGLSPLTGLLAIAVPYTAIFAKVYAEIAEETPSSSQAGVPANASFISRYWYVRFPDLLPKFRAYSLYRFECGLRASAVLGFVGLPTMGYYLETAFGEGHYSEVATLLILFFLLIATIRFWVRPVTLPLLFIGSLMLLPWGSGHIESANLVRFFTLDIVPAPLRAESYQLTDVVQWFSAILGGQIVPGSLATIQLSLMALVASGVLAVIQFPWISPQLTGSGGRVIGHTALVILRSTPEYLLAYLLIQLWGPSMLPAVVALALHNGAIVGHLVGRNTESLTPRPDRPSRSVDRYFYEVLPQMYPQLMAYLLYRWEVIMRETAVFGILGIATLGFYVDSAFADLRLDVALVLIAATAMLNVLVDQVSRRIRRFAQLADQETTYTQRSSVFA